MARSGARISVNDATVTGSGNDDLNVGSGSTIIAENCTTSTSTGGTPHSSDVNVPFNTLSGKGIVFAEAFKTAW